MKAVRFATSRYGRLARTLRAAAPLILLAAGPARAFDITSCDALVPPGSTGTLQADLSCSGAGVTLEKNAKLELNGHVISAPGVCVDASAGGTVRGPGELSACGTGILSFGRRRIRVSDVNIHGGVGDGLEFQGVGIWALQAPVEATNVVASSNGNSGIMVHVLTAEHVTASGNTHYGISQYRGRGEDVTVDGNGSVGLNYGSFGSYVGLVATNNGSPNFASGGLTGSRVVLRDSTVTGNLHFDISAFKKPLLVDTTCGTSIGGPAATGSWSICTLD